MTSSGDRLFTPAFVALTLSELAYFTSAGLVIGVTPFFVTGPLGSDEAGLGLVAGAFGVTTLLLRPWAGRASDRRGRRPLLLAGSSLFAVVVLAHALGPSFEVLVGLRLVLGVAEAMFFVAGYAALADLAPAGRAGEALSYNSLALYLGVALGPFAGQLLLDAGGFPLAWSGGAGLALVATLLALRIPETATRLGEPPTGALIHRAAVAPGIALFTGVAAMAGFLLLAGPYAERLGVDAWSVTFLVFGGTVVLLRVTLARLPDRLPPLRLGAAALGMCAAGLALVAAWPGFAGLMSGTVVLASGVAFMTPALFAATFARVVPGERGAAAGTATLFIDLGFAAGPLVVGYAAASAGTPFALGVGAGIALAGALATVAAVTRTARASREGQRPAASESARGSAPPS